LELQQALPWAALQPECPEASVAALWVALLARQPVTTLVPSTAGPLAALWTTSAAENNRAICGTRRPRVRWGLGAGPAAHTGPCHAGQTEKEWSERMKSQITKRALPSAVAICTIAFWTAVPADATAVFPYFYHAEQNIDNHQIGYVDVVLKADGTGWIKVTFSNGKQWAGNRFVARTVFMSADGRQLLCIRQTKTLEGSWTGHAREGSVTKAIHLTPEQLQAFDHAEVVEMATLYNGITIP
jgi:hypothetical protein